MNYKTTTQVQMKKIANTLIKFSLPLILSGILQQLYNWADAFIVGNVEGDLALAAVGSTTTVINFYLNAITGFTLGLAVLFAQRFGREDFQVLPKLLSTFSITLGSIFFILSVCGICLTSPLLHLLHTTQDTFSLSEDYLRIVLIGVPFLSVYNVYSAALRGIGDSKAPFYSVLISSFVNIGLDIWFVAFLHWSVIGAAVATVASQITMTVFIVIYSSKKYDVLRYKTGSKLFDKIVLKEGCRFGLAPMLQASISSAGNLVLQRFMNGFGTHTVTAVTTAYRVDSIVMLPILNLGSGISTLVAQKTGSGEKKEANQILIVGTITMALVALLLTAVVIPNGGYLVAMFGASQEAVNIGKSFFLRIASFYLVFGLATSVRSYLEGVGDMAYSSVAGIVSLAVRIILSYAMVSLFDNMVIAYAEAFSWVVLLLLYILRLLMIQNSGSLPYGKRKAGVI